jgi:hypothetical protein
VVHLPNLDAGGEWPAGFAIPEGLDGWDIKDALNTKAAAVAARTAPGDVVVLSLDRPQFWKLVGGPLLVSTDALRPVIGTTGNHMPVAAWYADNFSN